MTDEPTVYPFAVTAVSQCHHKETGQQGVIVDMTQLEGGDKCKRRILINKTDAIFLRDSIRKFELDHFKMMEN